MCVCVCVTVSVSVYPGVFRCFSVLASVSVSMKNFIVIKISDVHGGEGGYESIRTTPDRRGRGGLKITILPGRPL